MQFSSPEGAVVLRWASECWSLLMLSRLGYKADLAADGPQALKAAEKTPYDLILMDIQMPEMDRIEAARLVRKKLGANRPSIVALTAEALGGDKQRFLDLGFDGYLSKPLQFQPLQEMLKKVKMELNSQKIRASELRAATDEKVSVLRL